VASKKALINILKNLTTILEGGDMTKFVLAIDQGTTSSRAILFDKNYQICAIAQQELAQNFP
jgi:glycerol kinase